MADSVTPKQLVATLNAGAKHDLVIMAVPSHDRRNQPIHGQDLWAEEALRVFSRLFGGGTAFQAFRGVYRSETGDDLWDRPILIESYAERQDVENERNLAALLQFIRRMKDQTNQECVLLVINEYRWLIA